MNAGEKPDVDLQASSLDERSSARGFGSVNHKVGDDRAKMPDVEIEGSDSYLAAGAVFRRADNLVANVIAEPVGVDDNQRGGGNEQQQRARNNRGIPNFALHQNAPSRY